MIFFFFILSFVFSFLFFASPLSSLLFLLSLLFSPSPLSSLVSFSSFLFLVSFSSLFSCLLLLFFFFFLFFFLFFSFSSSLFYKHTRMTVTMGHTQRRDSNTCQEPGSTEMSDGMRSTNICQKPFILSCFVLSSLSSFSVFFLCLCLRVWCGVCRVVWHPEKPRV